MKKLLKLILWFIVLCIFAIIIAEILTVFSSKNNIYSDTHNIPTNKVGLLLGTNKHYGNGLINLFYKYRLDATIELYESWKIEYVLATGDNGREGYDEATAMHDDLIARWVPEEKIYLDYAGFRTLDSIVRAKEIFGQENFTIISQKFHIERAIFLAKSHGIDAVGYSAKDVPVSRSPRVWIRERLARVKMMIDIIFWVEPKFWGESIEIGV